MTRQPNSYVVSEDSDGELGAPLATTDPTRARDPVVSDPYDTQAPAAPEPTDDIVVLRPGDIRFRSCTERLITGTWSARAAAREWECSVPAARNVAYWAGVALRVNGTPALLLSTALAELRGLAEQARDSDELGVAVAAWKTILDALGKLVERAEKSKGADATGSLEELLRHGQTPPELAELLTRCRGKGTLS